MAGKAVLRLWDDGWRVEQVRDVTIRPSGEFRYDPVLLRRWEEKKAEAERDEQLRKERERVAKSPGREIETFEFSFRCPDRKDNPLVILRVTDAIVTKTPRGAGGYGATFGYWDISEIQFTEGVDTRVRNCWNTDKWIALEFLGSPQIRAYMEIKLADTPANREQVSRAYKQLIAAHTAWNTRYPDRVNWYPASR
jgi:hypothetical protein